MPWAVKVVARVRRAGQSEAQLRNRLLAAEGQLSAEVVAAILPSEPGATVRWSMRAVFLGGQDYEAYPKCIITLPSHEGDPRPLDPTPIYAKLRAVRDALITRLQSLGSTNGWTLLSVHFKLYGGS
jgi:hypothetical protein